ncbi:restriction endonuclease subunit S [Stutzerimonas nitrititolerans]|uniref:restriction endonuclease subunit S n=1 Tax=Stutzerimonas nitrititolerans TaxID=2482751 RepID=UPI0028A607DF|nr:restriction endonuclease subunit S [Stutzerimonas nitrititolerans]
MTFPRYPKYKASGFTWLGDVPEHWQLKRLGHYFDERRERASDTEFEPLSVTKLGIVPRLESAAKTQDGDNRKKVLAGDFVINSRSDRKGSSGLSPLDGSVSLICTVLIPTGLHGPFVHHLFRSELFQEEYYRWGKGIVADLWSTNFSDMKNIVLGVPSEAEQTQIARFLDHETARIDALIEEQQRLIELLKEKRQAVISHAVTKGLDPTVPMKDSGVEWLGEVPAHWVVRRIKHLTEVISKGTTPTTIGEDFQDEGIRFLKAENIFGGRVLADPEFFISERAHAALARSALAENDVLVVIAGATTGKSAVLSGDLLPANTNQAVSFIRLRDTRLSEFIQCWLSTDAVQRSISLNSVQSAQPNLSMEDLGEIPVPLPPLDEIDLITDQMATQISIFDGLISEAVNASGLLQERRSALISAAVTGKIDVRDWQPPVSTQAPESAVAEAN